MKASERKALMKDALVTAALAAVAIGTSAAAGWLVFVPPAGPLDLSNEEAQKLLKERDIVSHQEVETKDGTIVKYAYATTPLPEKLAPDEVVELRTPSSWSRQIGVDPSGSPIIDAVFYPKPQFIEKSGKWHQLEYGVATKEQFEAARKQNPIEALLWKPVYAQVSANLYGGTGDGNVSNFTDASPCSSVWSTTHDATDGTDALSTGLYAQIGAGSATGKVSFCTIHRAYYPFDTSSIPLTSIITSASLNVFSSSTLTAVNTDNDGTDYITVVRASQATHTTLTTADYDQCGAVTSPTEGIDTGQRKDISSLSYDTYTTFTLNATGRGWIAKRGQTSNCSGTTGITCLGLREGHDATNSAITDDTSNWYYPSTADELGTSYDPYLAVTYVPGFAFWQFQDY